MSWCAGRNPPSVQRRHLAERATRASHRLLPGAYLPFHLAGQPFHRFTLDFLHNLAIVSLFMRRVDVSFLRCCQGSHPIILVDVAKSAWWAEFPHAQRARKPSASSPTQKKEEKRFPIKFWNCLLKSHRDFVL